MVPYPGEVLDTSTTYQNDGVFLQVVPDAWDIGSNLDPVCKPDTRNFTQSRIGLLGCRCVHPCAYASALGTPLQSRTLRLITNLLSARSYQLIEGRQTLLSLWLNAARVRKITIFHSIPPSHTLYSEKPDEYSKQLQPCQAYSSE
jgi:hypothetical protein